jgi:hypothetical protein
MADPVYGVKENKMEDENAKSVTSLDPPTLNSVSAPFVAVVGGRVTLAREPTTWHFWQVHLDIAYVAVPETNQVFGVVEPLTAVELWPFVTPRFMP